MMGGEIVIFRLQPGEQEKLKNLAEGVFDNPINLDWAQEYISHLNNVLVVACEKQLVVGMASGHIYNHPDKLPEFWVNELGVDPDYQRRGIATQIIKELQLIAEQHQCQECWLLTEPDNKAANGFYQSLSDWQGPETTVMYTLKI